MPCLILFVLTSSSIAKPEGSGEKRHEEKRAKLNLTQSFDKTPMPTEKSKKQRDNINATKTLITQRLQTDLGRSVGVTAVTPLVWLNRCTSAQPSH